jgi:hypothetical protein
VQRVAGDPARLVGGEEGDAAAAIVRMVVVGYSKTSTSPVLGLFLSRIGELKKSRPRTAKLI